MSIYVSGMVWKHSRAKGTTFTVLLAIADKCDDAGLAYPKWDTSIDTLARLARVSRRTCQYAITELIELGELSRQIHGGETSSTFQVHLDPTVDMFNSAIPAPVDKPVESAGGGVQGVAREGCNRVRDPVQPVAPNPSSVPSRHVSGAAGGEKAAKQPVIMPAPVRAFLDRGITAEHRAWAKSRAYDKLIERHWEQFADYMAQAKNWRRYSDLDAAFRNCVRDDWGDVRMQAERSARFGAPGSANGGGSIFAGKFCFYCPRPATSSRDGFWHCGADACRDMAVDRRPASNPPEARR